MARLAAGLLVSALIRRIEVEGGTGVVLARGEATSGAVIVQLAARGQEGALVERVLDPNGAYAWSPIGPDAGEARAAYLARRRRIDPDLWIIELDHEDAAAILEDATRHI